MNTPVTPPIAPRRRRWPLVVAALGALLLLLVGLAPSLASGSIASSVEDTFNAQRQGTLDVGSLALAWTSRQRLENARLLAPDGSEVARVSAELPSLLELARSGGARLGKVTLEAQADLVADAQGLTNLERALAVRPESAKPAEPAESGEPTDIGQLLRELDLEFELRVARASWSDERTRAAGRPFAVEGLIAKLVAKPGQPLRIRVDGALSGDEPGKLQVAAELHDLLDTKGVSPQARFQLDAALDALPSAFIDALTGQPGMLAAALGPQFRVTAKGEGTLQSGTLDLSVTGERGAVLFKGSLVDGVLGAGTPANLQVTLKPERALLERYVVSQAPEGLTLEPLGEPSIDLNLEGLRVELQRVLDALNTGGDVAAAAIGGSEFTLRLSTNGWKAGGTLVPLEQGASLESLRVDMALAAEGEDRTLTAQLEGQLGAGASGFLSAQARIEDLARFLAADPSKLIETARGDEPRFDVTLSLQQLSSGALAALAPPEFPVAELCGRALDLRLDVTNGRGQREAQVRVTSPTLAVDLTAWMDGDVLINPLATPWSVRLTPPTGALAKAAAPYLPEGLELRPGQRLEVRVGPVVRVPLQALATAADPVALVLQRADVDVALTLDSLGVREVAVRALDLEGITLGLHLGHAPDAAPLSATFAARIVGAEGGKIELRAGCPQPGALDSLSDPLALPKVELSLAVDGLPVALLDGPQAGPEPLATKLGSSLALAFDVSATQTGGEPLKATLGLAAKFERGALSIKGEASVDDPFARRAARPAGALPPLTAQLKVDGLRTLAGLLPPDLAQNVLELAGDSLTAELANQPAAGSKGLDDTLLTARISAARVALVADARLKDGALSISDTPLELRVRPTEALIQRHVGASLPQGAALAFTVPEPLFLVRVDALTLPLDAWLPAEGAEPAALADVLRRTAGRVHVAPPVLRYTQPALGAGGAAVPVELSELAIDATLAPGQPAVVNARGKVGGAQKGEIALRMTAADVGAFVEGAEGAPLPPLTVEGDLTNLPTALIDALAAQDGLLLDVLGPQMSATVRGAYPSETDPLRAKLSSSNASLDLTARVDQTTLTAEGEQGLAATLPLSPLFSKRIVGNLVPLLVNATKPEGAAPVGVSVSAFSLPLDGDLRRINGQVKLDLGEVSCEVLPGIADTLASFGVGEGARRTMTLPSLSIPIVNGVAGYEALPISIGGKTYDFKGTFDLATSEMKFASELPLSLLGKKVSSELERVREYLDPNLLVPIELSGSWSKPRLRLGDKFVEDVVKKAAANALRGGLDDLFGKKKDKK